MSKRYGRNQRRKARQEIQRLEHVATEHYEGKMEAIRHFNAQARRMRALEREIGSMLAVLQPRASVRQGVVRKSVTAVAELAFVRPSPTLEHEVSMEQLYLLAGPEAQTQLALRIAEDFARAFSRMAGR